MFAKLIIDIKHEEVNQVYDYVVPLAFEGFLMRGMRVMVPFGSMIRMGYVIEITDTSKDATKEILEVLDILPSITDETFEMIDAILAESPQLFSAVFATVMPSGLQMNYQKEIIMLDEDRCPQDLKLFFNTKGIWKLNKTDAIYYPRLKKLYDQGVVDIRRIHKQKGTSIKKTFYTFNLDHTYGKIDQYPLVLDLYMTNHEYERKALMDLGLSSSNISTLVKHGVLVSKDREVTRELTHHFELKDKKVTLNQEQQTVYLRIAKEFHHGKTFLLKGITGSGKTEVYLKLIEDVIKNQENVMILVPEITLIGPMAKRLKSRFDDVAIYHSGLSQGEQYDQYQMIQKGDAHILLGTRSAVFLPIRNLGLIIIDEEQDHSYVQDEGVYYDAKKIALLRSEKHQIPLVLGSATPSIVSMYHAIQNDYTLLELTKRFDHHQLPKITFVDMKKELKEKNTSIFSRQLLAAMEDRLSKNEQIILLFNRKGYAPFVMCRQCGDVPTCPHCDISLTYYEDKQTLKCHYCGYEKPYSQTCEVCGQDTIKPVGVGIEYVHRMLQKTLPEAKIIRMDATTTRNKGKHEALWVDFANHKADILLGTQMVAKGLDFPLVTLVGVLMADMSLRVPSYQATEEAYMLLTQVTGRSGRFLPGEAIIQGYDLEHYAIKSVSDSYESFYKEAIYYRKLGNYQPFRHTAQILIEGAQYLKTYQAAFMLRKKMIAKDIDVLGPTPAMIKRIKDQFRFTITLKSEHPLDASIFQVMDEMRQKEVQFRYFPNLDIV